MGLGSSPRIPQSRPLPARPNPVDPAIQRAQADERKRLLARRGASSTFITGPLGLPGASQQVFRKPANLVGS